MSSAEDPADVSPETDGPTDDAPTERPRRRRRGGPVTGLLVALIGVLVLLLGTYGVGYVMAGDQTPRDARVAGIPIGGMTAAEAEAVLERELGPRANAPITLQIDGKSHEVEPADMGLGVDYAATVEQSGVGRNADPRHIWKVLAGGGDLDPVITVDEDKLNAFVAELADRTAREAVDAKVAIEKGKVAYTEPVSARALDVETTTQLIRDSYLVRTSIALPVKLTEPEITDADAADAKSVAEQVVAAPIVLKVDGAGEYTIPVDTLAEAYSFPVKDGKVVAELDEKKLYELNKKGLDKLSTAEPRDARVEIRNGEPHVVPAKDGNRVDQEVLIKALEKALAKEGEKRVVEVEPNGEKAEYTTEEAKKAGVKEVVSEFRSAFPYAEYRNVNLSVVARMINNTYLKPGDQFSLNGQIGPRSYDQGFIDGYFIEGGILKKGLAGGISQSATTVFNAAFFAGVQLDQWQPHTLYFSRYPAGRESTVYYPTIDVKFTNDTPYGMVVQAWVDKASPGTMGAITVRIWSTKYYEVETGEPKKTGFYSGTTRWVDDPKCEYQAPIKGFTASYYRIVRKLDGTVAKNENYSWKYSAGDEIKCGKKPDSEG